MWGPFFFLAGNENRDYEEIYWYKKSPIESFWWFGSLGKSSENQVVGMRLRIWGEREKNMEESL